MNKAEHLKLLKDTKRKYGHRSSQYRQVYDNFFDAYGNPGRSLPRPGDPTNGKKKKKWQLPFGSSKSDPEDV